jgi:hypothetical protein
MFKTMKSYMRFLRQSSIPSDSLYFPFWAKICEQSKANQTHVWKDVQLWNFWAGYT